MARAPMEELFTAVRDRAPADTWSKGVTLARSQAVSIEDADDDDVVARVTLTGQALTPTVTLYREDREWECDCRSPLEACEHVAAAVIAWRQGVGKTPRSRPIEYRFRRSGQRLVFERGVSDDAGFHPLERPLEAVASGTFDGPRFDATPQDLAVERALRGTFCGVLEGLGAKRVLEALAHVSAVTVDGEKVRASGRTVLPSVRVEDAPGGIRLSLRDSEEVEERFSNGIVLAEGALRPEGDPPLTGRERNELSRGRVYRPEEMAELVGEVLPSLERRLPVEIRSRRLPGTVREVPRLSIRTKRDGDRLYVLPSIVYGDPPRARLEGDRLVALGGDVPVRDREEERRLGQRLQRELGLELGRGATLDAEDAIALVAGADRFGGSFEGKAHESFRRHSALVPQVRIGEADLDLSFETPTGGRADPAKVLGAWRQDRPLVPLLEGGYAPLPAEWLDRHGERIADLLAAKEAKGELPKASLADLTRLAEELDAPSPPSYEKLQRLVSGPDDVRLPSGLEAVLRPYQREGVRWLASIRRAGLGGVLADDMGLGKTIQALAVLEGRSLVAAPTSVLRNWIEEARRFRPDLTVSLYHGASRVLDPDADLTVTSHALLRQDGEVLGSVSWDGVVVDEAQAIKNPESQLARAAFAVPARFRLALTGTPIENRLVDLWSQFHFTNPGFLGGLSDFEERYVRPIASGEIEPLSRLRERIRPFLLRRLKKDVAPELPPRTEVQLRPELTEEERELYQAVAAAVRRDVVSRLEAGAGVLEALEALLRLRQAACHPALVPGQRAESSSKTELLMDRLETLADEGHKALVFSQWTSMLDLLEPHLRARKLDFVRLDGSTRDRGSVIERFQSDVGVSVFLVSLKAGGTGLNLTAADHVFLFDPWWNPAVEEQAFDRAHRIGQDKPVLVYRLVAVETVEERILSLQEEKRALAELATTAGARATSLSREDLLRLLE